MMKLLFSLILIVFIPQLSLANSDLSGVYLVEYIAPNNAPDAYYKAQLILNKNGEAHFRDQPEIDQTMSLPGCIGSYSKDNEKLLVNLDCSLVNGPTQVLHTWTFANQGSVIQPKLTQNVNFQSNIFGNKSLEFSWQKIGEVVF